VASGDPRVLQVALSLNPGGTERLVVQLATRLHRDVPTAVVCLDEPGAWADQIEAAGISIQALGRTPGFHPSLGRKIAQAAAAHRATVIHAHHYSPFVYSCVARLWKPGVGVVFTEHGRLSDSPPSPKRRLANRILASFPRAVCAVSAELGAHLVAEGFPQSRVQVVHNGIDVGPLPTAADRHEVRAALGANDDVIVVGSVARLDPVKDLGSLLHAAAMLRTTGHKVLVALVGDGPERPALEQLAGTLGIAGDVRFLGHRDDARRWLAGWDVYVNCSVSEGVSLTILEAMAAALPVVATAVGGTPEVLDEASGVLAPSRDPAALAGALAALIRDPALRTRLAAGARARVEASFTLDRMVRSYAGIYRRS
jgi:L-malate glycosyltransferase